MTATAITALQAACAMGLAPEEMADLLVRCGIQANGGLLSREQVAELLHFLEDQQRQSRQRAQANLEQVTARYALLIDTCALLHPQFSDLMSHLIPLLRANNKTLIIPSGVMAELQHLNKNKPELKEQISCLIKQLAALRRERLVTVYGEASETFGDKQFLATATRFMTNTELLVITQDKALSEDLLHLNHLNSVRGKRLSVGRINRYGYISRYLSQERQFAGSDRFMEQRVRCCGTCRGKPDASFRGAYPQRRGNRILCRRDAAAWHKAGFGWRGHDLRPE